MIFPKPKQLPEQMDIPGFDGRYYVKQDGTVWHRRQKAQDSQVKGYRCGRSRARRLHLTPYGGESRMIAMSKVMRSTYFKDMDPALVLHHVNGLESDWSIWNLKPMTRKELGQLKNRKGTARSVFKIDPKTGDVLKIYPSARAAARDNYIDYQTVLYACNGKSVRHKYKATDGYIYRWEDKCK